VRARKRKAGAHSGVEAASAAGVLIQAY
jgi:hypothetical protein